LPYQSFYSGRSSTVAAPPSKGGGYQSAFGSTTIAEPSKQQLQQSRDKQRKDSEAAQAKQQQKQQEQKKQEAAKPKPQSLLSKTKSFVNDNVIKPTVSTVEKSANTTAAGVGTVGGLVTAGGQAATGHKQAAKGTLKETEKNVDALLSHGLGNKGGFLTPEQSKSRGGGTASLKKNFIKPAAQATSEVAPLAIPVGRAAEGASLLSRVAKPAIANAVVGSGATAANEAANTGHVKAKDVITSGVAGGLLGAGGQLVHEGGNTVTSKALNSIMSQVKAPRKLVEQAKAQALLTKAAEKNKVMAAKVDQKVELLEAKKADGKFTNVDKVKVQQLKAEKQNLGVDSPVTPPASALPTKPSQQLSGGAAALTKKMPLPEKTKSLSSTSLPNTTPTTGIKQALDSTYKPSAKPTAHETTAITYLRKNPAKALTDYDKRVKEKFGATNVVSGDEAKYVIPGFDSTKSVGYHEPASALAKVKYQQLLANETTKGKPVLLMSGGSGAGKTSALKRLGINYDNYAAVIDTNTNKLSGAESRIKQAVDAGHEVQVFYVHRDPVKAFTEGVIPRGTKEGRIVPIDTHLDTHYGSHEVVKQLADKYGDHPLVDITAASNNHGHGKARPLELDNIPKMRYSKGELRTILKKEVDNAHQKGQISPEEHALYHGNSSTVAKAADRQPEPQRTAGSEGKPEAKVATSGSAANSETRAVQAGLVKEFKDKAQYSGGSFKQEAANAVELVKTDPEKARSIALGQEPGNNTIHEVAVAKALENKALKEADTETLLALARSPRHTITSEAAQRLGAEGYESGNSVVKNIAALRKVRQDALEKKKGKPATEAVSKEIKLIKAAKPKVTHETWGSFVESLRC
jgi:hypothetical protein